jgi:hypothetical protein
MLVYFSELPITQKDWSAVLKYLLDFLKNLVWDKHWSLFNYTIARRVLQGTKTVAYFAKLTITQKDWMCNSQVSSRLFKKYCFCQMV